MSALIDEKTPEATGPERGELFDAFVDIMHALGRVHPGDRSRRIQKCMDLYQRMYPGIYEDEIGWTYIQHDLEDRMPEYTKEEK